MFSISTVSTRKPSPARMILEDPEIGIVAVATSSPVSGSTNDTLVTIAAPSLAIRVHASLLSRLIAQEFSHPILGALHSGLPVSGSMASTADGRPSLFRDTRTRR